MYFENLLNNYNIKWIAIYMLLCLFTYNIDVQYFPCKILNNVLFFDKIFFIFWTKPSPLCSFGNLYDEAPFHITKECNRVKCLCTELVQCFNTSSFSSWLAFSEFLIPQTIRPFLKIMKPLWIIFYYYLSYMWIILVKRVHRYIRSSKINGSCFCFLIWKQVNYL